MIALLLPAVQAAREAARRVNCASNQRQWLIALHNYHDAYLCLPPHGIKETVNTSGGLDGGPGTLPRVLPFIEAAALAQSFDFSEAVFGARSGTNAHYDHVANIGLKILNCPSDTRMTKGKELHGTLIAGGSYCVCRGSGVGTASRMDSLTAIYSDGLFRLGTQFELANIADGTSNTLALSEGLYALGASGLAGTTGSARYPIYQRTFISGGTITDDMDVPAYSAANDGGRGEHCTFWLPARATYMTFNTYLAPNQQNAADVWDQMETAPTHLYVAARSAHPGSVVTGNADASVTTVQNGIDRKVWANLGTTDNQINTAPAP